MHHSITPLFALLAMTSTAAAAEVRITEFMYQGASAGDREFVELTNIGSVAVDVSGWSYNDDNPNNPVAFGAAFGSLAANESVILTELSAAAFPQLLEPVGQRPGVLDRRQFQSGGFGYDQHL